jgi:small conductance mechanosensitive channel
LLELSTTERIGDAVGNFARDEGLQLILTALGTVIAVRLVRILLYRLRHRIEASRLSRGVAEPGRLSALFDVLDYLAAALVVAVGVMTGLSVLGVNTSALLASAGVLGFAVGFGAQTMVKDLLNGLFLLAEGQYTVGDLIEVSGVTGTVERVTLRTTTLRAFNGDVHIVPSGDVRLVTNRSKGWARVVIDAGVGYDTPVERAMAVLEEYCREVAADPTLAGVVLETPTVLGVEAFQDHQYLERAGIEAPVVSPSVTPVAPRTGQAGPTSRPAAPET